MIIEFLNGEESYTHMGEMNRSGRIYQMLN